MTRPAYTDRAGGAMTDIHTLDLEFFEATGIIASFLAPVEDGFVVFDTGPASAVEVFERRVNDAGFGLDQLRAIFATHVHLDHTSQGQRTVGPPMHHRIDPDRTGIAA